MTELAYIGGELELFARATNWKRYFASLLRPWIKGDVLEVGAGIGATSQVLWHPKVTSWVALEPDAGLAAKAATVRFDDGSAPEVIVGTLDDLDATRTFDAILYVDVLEHIADDAAELGRAAERLRPGGNLVVLSPAYPMLYSAFDRNIGHFRRYTRASLTAAFPSSLVERKVFFADATGLVVSLANRVLLRQSLPTRRQVGTWDQWLVPVSRWLDPVLGRRIGRSIIAVYGRIRLSGV